MIRINNEPMNTMPAVAGFTPNGLQRDTFDAMVQSTATYRYDSAEQLVFELQVRNAIVNASRALNRSGIEFQVFRRSKANPAFWQRTGEGGFRLLASVQPADAIEDIFRNGRLYGTECSTTMAIIYYRAMLDVMPRDLFNKLYSSIQLMDWKYLDRDLAMMRQSQSSDLLAGDARYFKNPDVDPTHPEWQGENAFYLGDGKYYGHGAGIATGEQIIRSLNRLRRPGATREAYLMGTVTRQDYRWLYRVVSNYGRTGSSAFALRAVV